MKKILKWIGIIFAVFIVITIIAAIFETDEQAAARKLKSEQDKIAVVQDKADKLQAKADEQPVKEKADAEIVEQPVDVKSMIDDSVYKPYTADNEPTAVKQFGSRLDDIQALREQFAEQAITSGKCEKVMMSEVKLDSDIKNPEFFVQCWGNGKDEQIYSNEADIKAGAPLLSKDEKGLSDKDATTACIKLIENNTKEYLKVDINYLADKTFVKMADGSAQVKIGVDVTNAFDAEVPYLASCNFDKDGNEADFSMTQGKR